MRFGVMQIFQAPPWKSPNQVIDEHLELAATADALGFDSIWLAEHHFSGYGVLGSPLVYAAMLASHTKRIRIGTAVLVLPFYHPVRLAEEVAFVDGLSKGRLELGIGRGYQPAEFRGFGVEQGEAQSIADEAIQVMKLAWSGETFSFHGKHFDFQDLCLPLRPVQQPHPPLRVAAVSLDTFHRAGSSGQAILTSPNFTPLPLVKDQACAYRSALTEAGYDPLNFAFPMMAQMYIGEDEHDAYATPERSAMWYQSKLATVLPGATTGTPRQYEQYAQVGARVGSVSYDRVFKDGGIFATPAAAIQRLRILRDEIGVTDFIAWPNFGGLDQVKVLASLQRFASAVMPALR